MKVLLFGEIGQLGWELKPRLAELGPVTAPSLEEVDFTRPDQVRACVAAAAPDLIVNAAAYTEVDRAESEPALAEAINARAPALLAEAAARRGAVLVHFSTDFVFDGTQQTPYRESDPPNPLSVYGRTKLDGDRALQASGCRHFIFRVSWLYGVRGRNFLLTMRRIAAEQRELRVVDDQVGSPTWCAAVARATLEVLRRTVGRESDLDPDAVGGLYHMTCAGATSWYGFARAFLPAACTIDPVSTDAFPRPAPRPAYSVLDGTRLRRTFGICMPDWQTALRECLTQLS